MNFQGLNKVDMPDFYLDVAFRRAKKDAVKTASRTNVRDKLQRKKIIEADRIKSAGAVLHGELGGIVTSFPKVEELPLFYLELLRVCVDVDMMKKSLGGVNWADQNCQRLTRMHYSKIRNSRTMGDMLMHKKSFYGRVSSVVKQIKKELIFLEQTRKTMKGFPTIKTSMHTVVIAGFPNVGKTTILSALSGSTPQIASYPFTTQDLMIGYIGNTIQLIDTPGLLDREIQKRNKIEKQSMLALKHLANKMLFVIDPTGTSGYSVDEQLRLLNDIAANFPTPIVVAINKKDIAEKEQISNIKEKAKKYKLVEVSAEKKIGMDLLLTMIS